MNESRSTCIKQAAMRSHQPKKNVKAETTVVEEKDNSCKIGKKV